MAGPEIGEALVIIPISFWIGMVYARAQAVIRLTRGNRRSIRNTIRGGR
jgi:hypothetical protein